VSLRFYCPDPPQSGQYRLRADEARHLTRVCRHATGDRVEIFDGKGFATLARIVQIDWNHVELVAEGEPIVDSSPCCSLTLATALPKGERLDWLIEKATELGVARLIPLVTERSVVDPRQSKLDRLRRTIIEASKQSRRNWLMGLQDPMSWADMVSFPSVPGTHRFIAAPDGVPPSRWAVPARGGEILLAVGPEGGFTVAEEELARAAGWHPIRLSTHVLRVETAGLAGAAILLARCEEQDHDERL